MLTVYSNIQEHKRPTTTLAKTFTGRTLTKTVSNIAGNAIHVNVRRHQHNYLKDSQNLYQFRNNRSRIYQWTFYLYHLESTDHSPASMGNSMIPFGSLCAGTQDSRNLYQSTNKLQQRISWISSSTMYTQIGVCLKIL